MVPLVRFDSYSVDYYEVEDKYFKEYPFRINVSTNCVLRVQKNIRYMVFIYCIL